MVFVSYILDNDISMLQTKFSYREGHEARRVGLKAMPLHQHVKHRHGERQTSMEIRPAPVHDLLEMADQCQHREHRLHQHAVLPLSPLTQFQVAWIPFGSMEGCVAQDNHPFFKLANQALKGLIGDIGSGTLPGY